MQNTFKEIICDNQSLEWKEFCEVFSKTPELVDKFSEWVKNGDREDFEFIISTIKRAQAANVDTKEINKFDSLKKYSREISTLIHQSQMAKTDKDTEEKISIMEKEFVEKVKNLEKEFIIKHSGREKEFFDNLYGKP